MMKPRYIPLRCHTEYSLIDGLIQIPSLIAEAEKDGIPALAITDQSHLFGVVKFYKAALAAGLKPLIGADLWLENPDQPEQPFSFTVLCRNNVGYKNLLQLISQCFIEGQQHDKAIAKMDWVKNYADGLIVLSGAEKGDIGHALLSQHIAKLDQLRATWLAYFPDCYYLELRRTGHPNQEEYIQKALAFAEAHDIPVVATNDIRFLKKDDFEAHEARVSIHNGWILSDHKRPRDYTEQQYFRSTDEMCMLFADIPEALANTVEIAKRCTVTLTLGQNFLPNFPVPEGTTVEETLCRHAIEGLNARLSPNIDRQTDHLNAKQVSREQYDERLKTECDVINAMGFAGYFLIVADFIRWAREQGIPVGAGRGSGAGSLVAYALRITDLDPLIHELLFERFLNPERVSLPDFDIDFCMVGRDRVIEYVMNAHGRDNVAQIITYGTMAARAVVRDVGRVLGMPYGQVDKLAKLIPFELGMTLDQALKQEILLQQRYEEDEETRTLIDLARSLEGITRNVGKHAGGVVIAPKKLTEFTALYCETGHPEQVITQFDKDDIETVGLVKFDFLGLRTLTIIDHAVRDINRVRKDKNEPPLDIQYISIKDPKTFELLKSCQTTAVFQLESRGMRDLVKRLQPDCFEDLVALVALFRPGPLQSGMVDDFINRKHGRARVAYPHPSVEPILKTTYGVILYQEQVMQIAQVLAGYSLGSADILRRAMGKKKPEEMAKQREIFCEGALKNNVPAATATAIFDLMEKFAGYGFNKSHSASYALLTYQTAWLKTHYPAAFMAAVASSDMDNTDKVVHYIKECDALRVTVIAPDVNSSDYMFQVRDDHTIVYGLGAIKGIGENAIESIIEARKTHPFQNIFDFCQRVDLRKVNRRVLEALIKAGAFDTIGPHRASIMASLSRAIQNSEQRSRAEEQGQGDLFGSIQSNIDTPVLTYLDTPPWSQETLLLGEKETIGFYLSGHPIQRYAYELRHWITASIRDLQPIPHKKVTAAGIITHCRTVKTKRNDQLLIFTLDDATGTLDVLCFSDLYQKNRELLLKDKYIVVEGEVTLDEFSGGFRMTARNLYTFTEARTRSARALQIHCDGDIASHMPQLAALFKAHLGSCPITLHYTDTTLKAKAVLRLGDAWRVVPTDQLLTKIEALLPHCHTTFEYA